MIGYLILLLSLCGFAAADTEAPPLFVSLGSDCEVAMKMRENGLRHYAFPFDWLQFPSHKHLIALLNENFEFFLDANYYIQNPEYPTHLEHTRYHFEFRHDWPFEDTATSSERYKLHKEAIHAKYTRRIERFRQLVSYPGKVFFIRSAYDHTKGPNGYWWKVGYEKSNKLDATCAKEIYEALRGLFFDLDFTLVVINYQDEDIPWINGCDGVVEFKIRKTDIVFGYAQMFRTLLQIHQMERTFK